MTSLTEVRSLVCSLCWHELFNTEQFQRLCSCQCLGGYCNHPIRGQKTVRQINESASNGCNWCSYIRTFTSGVEEFRHLDDVLSINICDFYPDTSARLGKNAYYLSMDWKKTKSGLSPGWALRLHAYTEPTNPAATFVTARKLQTEVHSEAARHQIQDWLAECDTHRQCPEQTESKLPTRVVEVTGPSGRPRLLVTNGMHGRYVALSYCWGGNSHGELNRSNLDGYTQHLDENKLPQTLREAIAVTRSIDIPYLWIDALCILQDSDNDRQHEMRTMERVYRESYITLVAASSDSVTQGFLKPRPEPPNSYTIPFRLSATQFGSISINELDEKEYDESTEPINTRAWTLQESLLAPRYLIYSSHTLQYRCSAGVLNLGSSLHLVSYAEQPHYSESLSTLSVPACDAQGELKRWLRLVMVYSTRSASLACDKLNAISAIANQFFSFLGPGYFAGIWEFQILWQLTWISSSSWDAEAGNRRSRVYRAPTWSWASIDGVVSYGSHLLAEEDEEQIYRCEVLGCDVRVRVVELPFGEVDNGVLRVRGVLRRAWLRSEWRDVLWLDGEDESLDAAEALLLRGFEQGDMKQLQNDASSDGDVRSNVKGGLDEGGEWPPMLVFCLPIAVNSGNISMGLLLANSGKDLFKRVGSFEDALTKDFDHHPQCEIAIV